MKAVVQTNSPERLISEVVSQLNEKLYTSRKLKENSKIKELLDKLKNDDIELLNCCLDKKSILAVHLWCKSQKALKKLQEMHESNLTLGMMEELLKVLPRWAEETMNPIKPIRVNIDSAHFIKEVGKLYSSTSQHI